MLLLNPLPPFHPIYSHFQCFVQFQLSVYEVARQQDFPTMSLIVEDFMKDNDANHSGD